MKKIYIPTKNKSLLKNKNHHICNFQWYKLSLSRSQCHLCFYFSPFIVHPPSSYNTCPVFSHQSNSICGSHKVCMVMSAFEWWSFEWFHFTFFSFFLVDALRKQSGWVCFKVLPMLVSLFLGWLVQTELPQLSVCFPLI